jgi:predicted transcriptional regulator
LEPEQVNLFQSDFKIVADYFVQMRTNKDYIPSKEKFDHVDEILKLMAVLTKDSRFEKEQNDSMEGGARNMCEVLDRAETKGEINGMVIAYNKMKFSVEQIAQEVGISVEEVQHILASLNEKRSNDRVSVLIDEKYTEKAMNAIHEKFSLGDN